MILQALTDYYRVLEQAGKIDAPGWAPVKVSYVLNLDDQGDITTVVCIKEEVTRGKKKALVPQIIQLPAPVKRTAGVTANFLCDNSSYILGADKKGKPKRSLECFQACKTLHETLLVSVEEPAARAAGESTPASSCSCSDLLASKHSRVRWGLPLLSIPSR